MTLASLDIAIIIIYFIGILLHGWMVGRKHQTLQDYFLAGRALPWYLIGLSLYASNMSGASFIGLMGATHAHGLVVFNYEWTATLVLLLFAIFMLPQFLNRHIHTIPEFLEKRFDRGTRRIFSAFTILAILFIDAAGALYAGGLVLNLLFPVFSLWQAIALMGLVAGIYTFWGGLSAVVVTDSLQALLLIVAGGILCWVGLDAIGGFDAMWRQIPQQKQQLFQGSDSDFLPWQGIGGVLILGFYYWTLNQFIAQRSLGARTVGEGQKGAALAGLLKLGNLGIMILPGLIGLALYPDLPSADHVFPTMVTDLLPIGLKGLVLAGLIAAIMSSLDSALNAGASLVTLDFIRPIRGPANAESEIRIGKFVTALFMLFAISYAPTIARFETLFDYVQSALAYVVPPIVAVYFAGLFTRSVTANAARHMLWAGIAAGTALFVGKEMTSFWQNSGLPPLHYTVMALLLFVIEGVILLFCRPRQNDQRATPLSASQSYTSSS